MKNIFQIFVLLITCVQVNAQVAIGKTQVDGDGILDFAENSGAILLPILQRSPSGAVPGTFYVDALERRVKLRTEENWVNLTDEGDYTFVEDRYQETGEGVILGQDQSDAPGILVLESRDKALILPKVFDPIVNLPNPQIGTICYDTKSDTIAVFDGKFWHFWK